MDTQNRPRDRQKGEATPNEIVRCQIANGDKNKSRRTENWGCRAAQSDALIARGVAREIENAVARQVQFRAPQQLGIFYSHSNPNLVGRFRCSTT